MGRVARAPGRTCSCRSRASACRRRDRRSPPGRSHPGTGNPLSLPRQAATRAAAPPRAQCAAGARSPPPAVWCGRGDIPRSRSENAGRSSPPVRPRGPSRLSPCHVLLYSFPRGSRARSLALRTLLPVRCSGNTRQRVALAQVIVAQGSGFRHPGRFNSSVAAQCFSSAGRAVRRCRRGGRPARASRTRCSVAPQGSSCP